MRQPMATELTQLSVGDWDFSTPQRHNGVVLRDVTAAQGHRDRCSRPSR